jgi:hypothetical protein
MPRGHPPGWVPVEAIAAAARLKQAQMVERMAGGLAWCGYRPAPHWASQDEFSPCASAPRGLNGYCRRHAAEYKRARYVPKVKLAARPPGLDPAALAAGQERRALLARLAAQRLARQQAAETARARRNSEAKTRAGLAIAADRRADAAARLRQPGIIVTRCCGGRFEDDGGWWKALHEPGCTNAWQIPTPARCATPPRGSARR